MSLCLLCDAAVAKYGVCSVARAESCVVCRTQDAHYGAKKQSASVRRRCARKRSHLVLMWHVFDNGEGRQVIQNCAWECFRRESRTNSPLFSEDASIQGSVSTMYVVQSSALPPVCVKRANSSGTDVGWKVTSTDLRFWRTWSPASFQASCFLTRLHLFSRLRLLDSDDHHIYRDLAEIENVWCGLVEVRIIWPYLIPEAE